MNKFTIIRQALEVNPNIYVVFNGMSVRLSDPIGSATGIGDIVQNCSFYAMPKDRVYTNPEELQAFLESLVPKLQPTHKSACRQDEERLIFGDLDYEEIIGTRKQTTEFIFAYPDAQNIEGLVDGRKTAVQERNILRCIKLNVLPGKRYLDDYHAEMKKFSSEKGVHSSEDDPSYKTRFARRSELQKYR